MNRTLYNTRIIKEENIIWKIKYYITKNQKIFSGKPLEYYGIEITSSNKEKKFTNFISGIFPYMHDAENLLKFLYENEASPISMPYLASEFIENNFLSESLIAIDLTDD